MKPVISGASRRKTIKELKRPWRDFIERKRLHDSRAREAVVDVFLKGFDHVDLQTLAERVRRRVPSVGLATVYRTMKLLEEAGLAHARHFGHRGVLYEVAVGRAQHDHLVCQDCGVVVEFSNEEISRLQKAVAAEHEFELHRPRHELYGSCAACRKQREVSPAAP